MAILDFSKAFDTVPHKERLNKLTTQLWNWRKYTLVAIISPTKPLNESNSWRRTLRWCPCRLGRTTMHSIGTTTILMPHKWPSWMCQIPSQTVCRRLPLIQRNKIATRPSNSPRRPQITRTLGRQMGHEIQRKEMLHNEHETEIELLLPTRSAHSRTNKDKSILRT
jgi:hypothetical protein